jgi:hypothetical protein
MAPMHPDFGNGLATAITRGGVTDLHQCIAVQIPTRISWLVDPGMLFLLSSSQQKASLTLPSVKQEPLDLSAA